MALIERGVDIGARDSDQITPLHYACIYGHSEVAIALMERGTDIDARNDWQRTPLHCACIYGHSEVAFALVERRADIDAKDEYQRTPLHWASEYGHSKVAIALIERGVDCRSVHYRDSSLVSLFERPWNFSPLMCALYEDCVSSFRDLLAAHDESSDVSSADGWGVLHAGGYLGRKKCVVLYLQSE